MSEGSKRGYSITEDIRQQTGITLGPGTLYGSLAKLAGRGLIRPLDSGDRSRPYEITAAGRAALRAQLASWSRIVKTGKARLQWG